MTRVQRSIKLLALALLLALTMTPGHVLGQLEPPVSQAAIGTGFLYQGRLKDSGGGPLNGTCDFDFSLWDAGDGPTGSVKSYARQESATDIALELTDMIRTQRA